MFLLLVECAGLTVLLVIGDSCQMTHDRNSQKALELDSSVMTASYLLTAESIDRIETLMVISHYLLNR